jgi:hypothetical protein
VAGAFWESKSPLVISGPSLIVQRMPSGGLKAKTVISPFTA